MPKSHGVLVTAAIKNQSLDLRLVISLFISQPSVLSSETLRKKRACVHARLSETLQGRSEPSIVRLVFLLRSETLGGIEEKEKKHRKTRATEFHSLLDGGCFTSVPTPLHTTPKDFHKPPA